MRKLTVLTLLLLGACAKHDSPQPTSPDTLATKPPVEVLGEKYEQATLICRLFSERSLDGDIHNAAVDTFRVDLKTTPSIAGTTKLKYIDENHRIEVRLTLQDPKVVSSLTLNTGRKTYVMRNTITVPFTYQSEWFTRVKRGQSVKGADDRTYADSIYERVPYLVFKTNDSAEPEGRIRQGPYVDKVECLLDTKINAAYIGDYTEVSN